MDTVLQWAQSLGNAALTLLMQPYYYIAALFLVLYYRSQVLTERKLFSVKLHAWGRQTWRSVWTGAVAGFILSAGAVALGISVAPDAVLYIWAVSLLLMLLRVRYLCFVYSVGVLGVLQTAVSWFPPVAADSVLAQPAAVLAGMNIPALLALAGLLHLAEALLLRLQGEKLAQPLFLKGKRGMAVGGYRMEAFWPVPLFLLLPAGAAAGDLPWSPMFTGGGLGFAALPVILGFSELTQSMLPQRKAARTFGRLLAYGLVVAGLALLAAWWPPLTLVAALAALLLHEGLIWYSSLEERSASPVFVHPPHGLKVLAVLPGSPADELGIRAGEVVLKVNGQPVTGKAALHAALRVNPAYCKLEIENNDGESKFVQRAIYAGDHHQLGIVLAPEPDEPVSASEKPAGIFRIVSMKASAGSAERRKASGNGTLRRSSSPQAPKADGNSDESAKG